MPINDRNEVQRVGVFGAEKRLLNSRRVRTKNAVAKKLPLVYLIAAGAALAIAAAAALLK